MPSTHVAFRACARLAFLLWLLTGPVPAWAQREADNWYFGDRVGFRFASGGARPTPVLDGQMNTLYATAVASDPATGQLRFYSNAERVWNRFHQVMPHGDSLRGSRFVNQGALVVPVPGQPRRYYLFTLRQRPRVVDQVRLFGASDLSYGVVDLDLDGGRGDVVAAAKNVPLAGGLAQKLTAVRHANGRDYWVLVHDWGTAEFLVFLVTDRGVGTPLRQALGPAQPANPADTVRVEGTDGYLQASPDGRRLVSTTAFGVEPLALFDFDAATGTLSRYVNLGLLRDAFGVCFSPNNTKLYVQNFSRVPGGGGYNVLSQYDLAAGSDAAVAASGRSVVAGNPATNVSATEGGGTYYALQNGPDGRMYGAPGYRNGATPPGDTGLQTLFVLDRPNAPGFACGLRAERIAAFGNQAAQCGLPNFLQHTFNGREPAAEVPGCDALGAATVFPNPATDACFVRFDGACPQPYTLVLYDALGRQVARFARTGAPDEPPFSVAFLAAGLYVTEVRFARWVSYHKLVKH